MCLKTNTLINLEEEEEEEEEKQLLQTQRDVANPYEYQIVIMGMM
jgi:hypothetical protein